MGGDAPARRVRHAAGLRLSRIRRCRCADRWDISPHWQIESDLSKTSEFEVRFSSETPERTRVEIEHRHLDRHGPGWEGVREGVAGEQGWPLYLERFAEVLVDGR